MTTQPINPIPYLRIDHRATVKQLGERAALYNAKMELEHPADFKKRTIKSNHLETASKLISMLNAHIDRLRKHDLEFKEFKVNNPGLATMIGCGTKKAKTTAWRHLKALERFGFVTAKHFHGSHHDYGLELNEDWLIAQNNIDYKVLVIDLIKSETGCELSVENTLEIEESRPLFRGFFSRQWFPSCNHSKARTDIENNNLKAAVSVNNPTRLKSIASLLTETGLISFEPEHRSKAKAVPQKQEPAPPVAPAPPAKQGELSVNERIQVERMFTKTSLTCMMSILYPNYLLWQQEHERVVGFLKQYYSRCKTYKQFADLSGNFKRRIILTANYIDKYPHRYIPSPAKWLNPYNEFGFSGTKRWLEEWRKGEAQNKEYNAGKKTLEQVITRFERNPDTHTFENGMKLLKQRRDTRLADMFSRFVLNRKETYLKPKQRIAA